MFQRGKQDMTDMQRPGWTHTVTKLKNTAWVENAEHKDRCQTIHFLSIKLNMSIRTVHPIIRHLGCLKLCSQCVPCLLENKHKKHRMYHWTFEVVSYIILKVMCICGRQSDPASPFWYHIKTSSHTKETPWFNPTKEIQVKSTCQKSNECILWHQRMPVTGLQTT